MASPQSKAAIVSAAVVAILTPFVMSYEGDKSVGYRDAAGIATAGVGHTGPDVVVGKFYDKATREGWLTSDLTVANAVVDRCAPDTINVYQRAAFVDFAFNVGHGKKGVKDGFCVLKSGKKPSFLRKAWAGDMTGACNGLLAWDTAKVRKHGKVKTIKLKGLTRRRKAERDLCMTPVAPVETAEKVKA